MKKIIISSQPDFNEWRAAARQALQENCSPDRVIWQDNEMEQDLFSSPMPEIETGRQYAVPKDFLDAAAIAINHTAPERFALLYRILWRLCRENKNLLRLKTDNDILKLNSFVKGVRRDAYKIKAFLRFREVNQGGQQHFIAWYEPEYYSLELALPFFQTRFQNMNWSILTPYLGAYWDGETLTTCKNPDPSLHPKEDEVEKYWLKYYASTFNPARPKKQAMLNQMPKKYWKNMPETVLIKNLLQNSEARTRKMVEAGQNQ